MLILTILQDTIAVFAVIKRVDAYWRSREL